MNRSISRGRTLAECLKLEQFIVDRPILGTRGNLSLVSRIGGGSLMIYDYHAFEDLDWECPYCGKSVRLVMLDSTEKFNAPDPDLTMMGVEEYHDEPQEWNDDAYSFFYIVAECPRNSCKRKLFAKVLFIKNEVTKIVEAYPYPTVRSDSFPDSIPLKIREDFAEASRCFHATAYKAVVVMCRRVIQGIAKDKNVGGDTNKIQIKNMRDAGLITLPMFDAAHEIRHFGGYGAHPQDDDLDDITQNIASGMLESVNQFLTAIYVMEGKNREFAKHRQNTKQGKP